MITLCARRIPQFSSIVCEARKFFYLKFNQINQYLHSIEKNCLGLRIVAAVVGAPQQHHIIITANRAMLPAASASAGKQCFGLIIYYQNIRCVEVEALLTVERRISYGKTAHASNEEGTKIAILLE